MQGFRAASNVVGYNLKTPTNFKFLGPNFIDCNGTEDITLADFKVNCDETDPDATSGWAANYDTVVLLNAAGNNIRNLVYIPQWLAEIYTEVLEYSVTKGWYDVNAVGEDMHTKYDTTPIDFGMAVQVNISSGYPNAGVTFSGSVKTAPTVTDVENFMSLANCSPKDITLADVKVNCDETDPDATSGWAANYDTIVMLDSAGNNIRNLVYIPQWLAEVYTEVLEYTVVKGWYDVNTVGDDMHTNYNNVSIPAGEGFQVNASSGYPDITVQIDPAL